MRCLYLFLDPEGPPSVSVVATSRGTMNLPAIADFASCDVRLSWSDRPRFERDRRSLHAFTKLYVMQMWCLFRLGGISSSGEIYLQAAITQSI